MAIMEAAAAAAATAQTLNFLRSLGNKISPEVLEAVTEAYFHALTSQQEQLDLIRRVQELEEMIAKYDKWETEKERYEHYEIGPGNHVYRLREECKRGNEPDHFICPSCYEDRRKSILQDNPSTVFGYRVSCLHCGADIRYTSTR